MSDLGNGFSCERSSSDLFGFIRAFCLTDELRNHANRFRRRFRPLFELTRGSLFFGNVH